MPLKESLKYQILLKGILNYHGDLKEIHDDRYKAFLDFLKWVHQPYNIEINQRSLGKGYRRLQRLAYYANWLPPKQ